MGGPPSAEYAQLSSRDFDEDEESHGDVSLSAVRVSSSVHRHDVILDDTLTLTHTHSGSHQAHITHTPLTSHHEESNSVKSLRNEFPAVISRVPTKLRDAKYGVLFAVHLVSVVGLSLFEQTSLAHAGENYRFAGSWASIIMIVTLLGAFMGAALAIFLWNSSQRELLLSYSLSFSLVLKILLGNALLIMRSVYSVVGVLLLLSAFYDSMRHKTAQQALAFTLTLLDLTRSVCLAYGASLVVFLAIAIFAQSCVLLWWGAFFSGVMGTCARELVLPLALALLLSLFWVVEVFQCFVSFVVGGCTLWLFVREREPLVGTIAAGSGSSDVNNGGNNNNNSNINDSESTDVKDLSPLSVPRTRQERERLSQQLVLYTKCALTASFGSLCKAALCVPLSHALSQLRHTILARHHSSLMYNSQQGMSSRPSSFSLTQCICVPFTCVRALCESLPLSLCPSLFKHNRLTLPLLAVYGRTLTRTAEDCASLYSHTLSLSSLYEDSTLFTLHSLSVCFSAIVSVCLALSANNREGHTWPLFLLVCYFVCSAGVSLFVSVFGAMVDAFIVASALRPEQMGKENPLVLLRFFRTAEMGMEMH